MNFVRLVAVDFSCCEVRNRHLFWLADAGLRIEEMRLGHPTQDAANKPGRITNEVCPTLPGQNPTARCFVSSMTRIDVLKAKADYVFNKAYSLLFFCMSRHARMVITVSKEKHSLHSVTKIE